MGIDLEEIVKSYKACMPLSEIAGWNKISVNKVIKLLVTAQVYTSKTYDKVKELRQQGKTEDEITDLLQINKKSLNTYTPYQKGVYRSDVPTANALRIREHRERKGCK